MAVKPNHECRICNLQYYSCDSCNLKNNITWTKTACSEIHGNLYSIIIHYRDGQINKEQASSSIKALGIKQKEIDSFVSNVRDKVNEILSSSSDSLVGKVENFVKDKEEKIITSLKPKTKKSDVEKTE